MQNCSLDSEVYALATVLQAFGVRLRDRHIRTRHVCCPLFVSVCSLGSLLQKQNASLGGQMPHMLRKQILESIVDDGCRMSCRNPVRRIACTLIECDVGPRLAQTPLVQLAHGMRSSCNCVVAKLGARVKPFNSHGAPNIDWPMQPSANGAAPLGPG